MIRYRNTQLRLFNMVVVSVETLRLTQEDIEQAYIEQNVTRLIPLKEPEELE